MGKMKVLVVEDEGVAAMALEMELSVFEPIEVRTVSSGEEAVSLAEEFMPDLIFMDIYLDGRMNGIEAVRQIHEKKKIPIVYTTASQSSEIEKQILQTESIGFLQKPYMTAEITQIMAQLLG